VGDEVIDLLDQFAHVAEGVAADGALGDERKPALDLIEAAGIGGGEVQVIAGMTGQPGFDLGVFVGGVIVQNQVHVEVGQDVAVQMLGEGPGTPDGDGALCTGSLGGAIPWGDPTSPGNLWRRLALPKEINRWLPASLLALAGRGSLTERLLGGMPPKIAALPLPAGYRIQFTCKQNRSGVCTEGRRSWLPRWPEGLEPAHLRPPLGGRHRQSSGTLTRELLPGQDRAFAKSKGKFRLLYQIEYLASQTGDQMASLGNSILIREILRRSKISGQLIQMHRRRKQKHRISCGDENGLYPAPASGGVPALHVF
jgi:hypothetical protein